jgi:hypothetical protein
MAEAARRRRRYGSARGRFRQRGHAGGPYRRVAPDNSIRPHVFGTNNLPKHREIRLARMILRYQVLAQDLPGHGQSEGKDVAFNADE